jgi:hypothetical protein
MAGADPVGSGAWVFGGDPWIAIGLGGIGVLVGQPTIVRDASGYLAWRDTVTTTGKRGIRQHPVVKHPVDPR